MSERADLLDDFSEHSGTPRNAVFYSISPALERARAAREALVQASVPEPPPGEPEAVAPPPEPSLPRVVTTRDELLDLIRRRRDELGITHETIDVLTGWAAGYASKVLSPEPVRGLGANALALVIGALALGIARVEFVEDPQQVEKMRSRWVPRRRPQMKPRRTRGALLASRTSANCPEMNSEMER
ncbi:hypothetical protein M2232_001845 [Bradyrhizobium japonicum]|uniref:hypothetical protein n=1 Tax=Bradyrhizobium japonicum TaxID=375 RepID=UPI0022266039|nr:hypothetical protein [Bradyrhizobium japonicum]MCW2218313.1 hypothetical protein [Bradyrhizobium japonicum]MCW2342927.1 hypothetical protein [Bradyrhizobium japonicum]